MERLDGVVELIRHLHELVDNGILERRDQKTIPPCVDYSLSPYGMTLFPLVEALCSWGRIHLARGHTVSKTATAPDLRR